MRNTSDLDTIYLLKAEYYDIHENRNDISMSKLG